jgi:hypothetical protein
VESGHVASIAADHATSCTVLLRNAVLYKNLKLHALAAQEKARLQILAQCGYGEMLNDGETVLHRP